MKMPQNNEKKKRKENKVNTRSDLYFNQNQSNPQFLASFSDP